MSLFAELTDTDGDIVLVNMHKVKLIQANDAGGSAIIFESDSPLFFVQEAPEQILELIAASDVSEVDFQSH